MSKITKTQVQEHLRSEFFPNALGSDSSLYVKYENLTYAFLEKASTEYAGGFWDFYNLSNGGFYMAPSTEKTLKMEWLDNYYKGEMSADAAGICMNLMTLNAFAWQISADRFAPKYQALLDYASEHEEAPAIFRFID